MEQQPKVGGHRVVLGHMLDRLYGSLMRGPGLNCRPARSRQRVDLTALSALRDVSASAVLTSLLKDGRARVTGTVTAPAGWQEPGKARFGRATQESSEEGMTPERRAAVEAFRAQRSLLQKLSVLSEEARTYEQDTGVHALHVGYPLLSVPPESAGGGARVLGPVAFVPVSLVVRGSGRPGVELSCVGEGVDRVMPNPALFAWVERQTGKRVPEGVFSDEEGADPWRELSELVSWVTSTLEIAVEEGVSYADPLAVVVDEVPGVEGLGGRPRLVAGAVLGLFPAGNQGLVRDTREMMDSDVLDGPVRMLVEAGALLREATSETPGDAPQAGAEGGGRRRYDNERFVTLSDPFQGLAVSRSSEHAVLVMHGPPGTGKSQTITNMIADHLARGERVLFVCDKRTALDVVMNRLEGQGLGGLCAVVHDPARDQRDLYMKMRARLDELTELKASERAEGKVQKLDEELTALHGSLWALYEALMQPMRGVEGLSGESFHALMGRWLTQSGGALAEGALKDVKESELVSRRQAIEVALERSAAVGYAQNPWREACAGGVDAWLSRSKADVEAKLVSCVSAASACDATRHESVPPWSASEALGAQATRREALRGVLSSMNAGDAEAERIALLSDAEVREMSEALQGAEASRAALGTPIDTELWEVVKDRFPSGRELAEQLGALEQYLGVARRWWSFLAIGAKGAAKKVLRGYGLALDVASAERVKAVLVGLRARSAMTTLVGRLSGETFGHQVLEDASLRRRLDAFAQLLRVRSLADNDGMLRSTVKQSLTDASTRATLIEGLTRSAARASAMIALEQTLEASQLFNDTSLKAMSSAWRGGAEASPTLDALQRSAPQVEGVLRVRETLEQSPEALRSALLVLMQSGATPAQGWSALERALIDRLLRERMSASPALSRLDPAEVEHGMQRIAELENQKRKAVRDAVLSRWLALQQRRLLTGTGTRMSTMGAALRQRLFVRGSKAMRLRQMLAVGRAAAHEDGGGDPLFDLCPVWLCSPETVAQVFPREALFDVVIFDEASQVRLEESLPVLMRAKRVVIAGDTKQLPPTRFFEAGVASSDDEAIESEEQLFEVQQREVEDLLTAVLNLNVQESYLNVHYRSKRPELIGFSNEHFYGGRLQAVPGHPDKASDGPPVELIAVGGVYRDRTNEAEAERVVTIVETLLSKKKVPSIGIACFNLVQRDLIVELLDEKAEADEAFGKRLAEARELVRDGGYEGLFVKNLENVQGDERDHLIISTTYGPTQDGRFYRRFGPLALSGGGRRLNVLVTRAREKVWVVTSIPGEAYRTTEPVPAGATPGGPWLLMAYLRYAEKVTLACAQPMSDGAHVPTTALKTPAFASDVARGVGERWVEQGGCTVDVGWGNAGFCVDVVLRQQGASAQGVLCDMSRYEGAGDAVAWDVFRDGILRWQGWSPRRVWSPRLLRDLSGELASASSLTLEQRGGSGLKQ